MRMVAREEVSAQGRGGKSGDWEAPRVGYGKRGNISAILHTGHRLCLDEGRSEWKGKAKESEGRFYMIIQEPFVSG